MSGWIDPHGEPIGGNMGQWSREKVRSMDMKAQARMLACHPRRCSPHVKQAILTTIAKRNFAKAEAERIAEQDAIVMAMVELTAPAEPIPADALTCNDLALVSMRAFGVSMQNIKAPSRVPLFVRARQTAMWMCRRCTGKTWYTIAKAMGGRDHATAIHAAKTVQNIINALGINGGEDPKRWAELLASLTQDEWTAARRSQATSKMRRAA